MSLFILNQQPSIAHDILMELRCPTMQQDRARFRQNLRRLANLLAYELSKTLPRHTQTITTQLGEAQVQALAAQPVLLTILRAGLPFYDGFLDMFNQADSGFAGAFRANDEVKDGQVAIELGYQALPELTGRDVILIDPMLATGSSLLKMWQGLARYGKPRSLHIAAAIAAPEGVAKVQQALQEQVPLHLWLGALDEGLNDHAYIVPGLGDAGDLCFGTKLG